MMPCSAAVRRSPHQAQPDPSSVAIDCRDMSAAEWQGKGFPPGNEVVVDQMRIAQYAMTLQHRHGGEWMNMVRVPAHDSSARDPERHWLDGDIYACPGCDEQIRVAHQGDSADEPR